jgi:hypothetical protein
VTLPLFSFQTAYLTNQAFGYPTRGAPRRVEPIALACLHITANPNNPPASARAERDYANRAGSGGPSAHLYVDPKGGGVWAIDPEKYAAWTNGDVRSPRLAVPGVADVIAFRGTYNANEAYAVAIEQVGRYPDYPITPEQVQSVALVIAQQSIRTGLPIERRTVHLHGDLNTETRRECPVPVSTREHYAEDVIRRANEYRLELENAGYRETIQQLQAASQRVNAELVDVRRQAEDLADQLTDCQSDWEGMKAIAARRLEQRDEAVEWGKRLQSFGAAITATDKPGWVDG